MDSRRGGDAARSETPAAVVRWQWFLVWAFAGFAWGVASLTLPSSAYLWIPVAVFLTLQAVSRARNWREFLGFPAALAVFAAYVGTAG